MPLKSILESLIFASDRPLTGKQLRELAEVGSPEELQTALDEIDADHRERGVQLAIVAGGYQFRTNPENATWVRRLLAGRPPRLTQAMLETLAIVAYRQPTTRPEIEDIRGVDCGGVIRILLERGLVRILGKKEEVGRPLLYGTTKQFLEFFNLRDLRELPTLREFTELSEESAERVEAAYGEAEVEAAGAGEVLEGPPRPPSSTRPAEAAPDATVPAEGVPEASPEAPATTAPPEDEVEAAAAATATAAAPTTFARASRGPIVGTDDEEEEDATLESLDRAMERIEGILKAQKDQAGKSEDGKGEAEVGEGAAPPEPREAGEAGAGEALEAGEPVEEGGSARKRRSRKAARLADLPADEAASSEEETPDEG
jgi:segregation and condensation protein B